MKIKLECQPQGQLDEKTVFQMKPHLLNYLLIQAANFSFILFLPQMISQLINLRFIISFRLLHFVVSFCDKLAVIRHIWPVSVA